MEGDAPTGLPVMRYQSENFILDTDDYSLTRNGVNHPIEPRVFDLLVYLITNRNRVVTREELLDRLWNGRIVSDSAINARLKEARKAVGDSGKKQGVIKTIHRRGYQFVAEVQQAAQSDSVEEYEPLSRSLSLQPGKPSIAVLPFANMSDDPEQEYFSDGITEDIITGLGRFRELFVIARGSSFAFKGQSVDVAEAAEQLGAQFVLEGSVRKSGARVRITAQLSDATNRNQLWVESYDRVLEDVFAVQDDVAQKIISTLAIRLEDESRQRAMRKGSRSLSAYDYYLRGKHFFPDWRGSKDGILRARRMFEMALELDPDYALAYSGLAETYIAEALADWSGNRAEAAARTIECANKAVELDNHDSHAHIMMACANFSIRGNFELAEIEIQKALELNPNDYWNYCLKSEFSMCCGDFEDSIHSGKEAIDRNPFLPDYCLQSMGFSEYFAERYENAIKTLAGVLAPGVAVTGCIAACYAQLGKDKEARAAASDCLERARNELSQPSDWDNETWREYWSELYTFKNPEQFTHLFGGLRKAGLIE